MLLEVKDLNISLTSEKSVAEHISFRLGQGEMLSIVGSSGAGKTTICKAIMGLLGNTYRADVEILFQGEDLLDLPERKRQTIYGKEICLIMQNPMTAFNPSIRVGRQMEKTYLLHHGKTPRQEMQRLFAAILQKLGLEDTQRILNSYPFTLSGGMLQRLMIAAALMCQPALLVADEATTAIDACNRIGLMRELKSFCKDGMSVLFVTHDLRSASVSDRILVMDRGQIVEQGKTEQILNTPKEDYAVATDEYTVELHLTQPYYNTLRELCLANPFGIVSSEQFNEDLTAKQESFRSATYGTGPYMYAGDNDGQTWNFVRNPNYWGEAPEVDSFSIKYIPDNDAKILAMQNGEVDFLSGIKNVSAESYAQMEQTDGYGAQVDEKSLQTYYVGYNLSSEIFGDQVVREAISSAIDKDAVVDNIYGGLFDKADTFFSRDLPYCDVEQTVYGFDLDHANQILDEAGYVDTDGDGIREKDGVKLSAAFMYQTGTASDDNMVVYICDQASKIGIELTPQSAQMMDWYAMIQSGDYGLTIFKTQGGYYDPAMVITNINPSTSMDPILMQIGASQPELAALVDELDSATDEARIQEIYNTILTTMADQCLTTPLIYTRQLAIYSDAVASYTFPTDASFTSVQNIHLN